TSTHSNRTLLNVKGTVANIEKAFRVNMRLYNHPTEARRFYAPDTEPSADPAVPILDIVGLNDLIKPHPMLHREVPPKAKTTADVGSGPGGSYMGKDFRNAYIPGVGRIGAGQSVGLFELDGYYANDPIQYAALAGITNTLSITNALVNGYSGNAGANNV